MQLFRLEDIGEGKLASFEWRAHGRKTARGKLYVRRVYIQHIVDCDSTWNNLDIGSSAEKRLRQLREISSA